MDYVLNVDSTYTDGNGNHLVGSDSILASFCYDTTGESWRKDFSVINDFQYPYFSSVVSGTTTAWQVTSVESVPGSYGTYSDFALPDATKDIIRANTVVTSQSSYYSAGYVDDTAARLLVWPYKTYNVWTTTSGWGWASFDLGSARTFDTVQFDWNTNRRDLSHPANTVFPRGYQVQYSSNGVSYTTLASGTVASGSTVPIYLDVTETTSRYVRIMIDRNWGGARTGLGTFGVFKKPLSGALIMYQADFSTASENTYGEVSQSANFTGMNTLYLGFGCYFNDYHGGTNCFKVLIDSTTVFNSYTPTQYGAGAAWFTGMPIDVSAYSGPHTIRFRFRDTWDFGGINRPQQQAWVKSCSSHPTWYDENPSIYRGSRRAFPTKVAIVSDTLGLSILDISEADPNTGLPYAPRLWMRFVYHTSNYLQYPVVGISAKEGRVSLATNNGAYIIDFTNDYVEAYNTAGHYRIGRLENRNNYTDGTSTTKLIRNTIPSWITVGTAATDKLYTNVLRTSSMASIPSGLTYKVFGSTNGVDTIISGTVYHSKFKSLVNDVKISSSYGPVIFSTGSKTASKVGILYDISKLGTASFDVESCIHQKNDGISDTLTGDIDTDSWSVFNGKEVSVTPTSSGVYFSGAPNYLDPAYSQHCLLVSKIPVSSRPFKATAYVKIKRWPDLCPGEFRFGVFNNDVVNDTRENLPSSVGLYMSARNNFSYPSRIFSQKFSDGAWCARNIISNSPGAAYGAVQLRAGLGLVGAPDGSTRAYLVGQFYSASPLISDCVITFKVAVPYAYRDEAGATLVIHLGLANNQTSTSATQRLYFQSYKNSSSPAGAFTVTRYQNPTYWSSTGVGPTALDFTGDFSYFHNVRMVYEKTPRTLTVYMDDQFLGSQTLSSTWTAGPYITAWVDVSGDAWPYGSYVVGVIKDFQMDYGSAGVPSSSVKKYATCKKTGTPYARSTTIYDATEYEWGHASNPYVASMSTAFSGTEGTDSEPFRKWDIYYDPQYHCISSYIDNYYVGTATLDYTTTSLLENQYIGFDAQFYPATTISGNGQLEVVVKDVSVEYTGRPFNDIYSHGNFAPSMEGTANSIACSSETATVTQINGAVGSDMGASKFSIVKPEFVLKYIFDGASVPTGWTTKDIPGSSGSSSWTVASGVLKQTGNKYGHGGMSSDYDKYMAPFGTHLVSNIPCSRSYASGKVLGLNIRTSYSGCVGIGFNAEYSTVGTISSGSGYYVTWCANAIRVGHYMTYCNTSPLSYSYEYSVLGCKPIPDTAAVIGVPRNIAVSFESTTSAHIYIDGVSCFTVDTSLAPLNTGTVAFISNNNTNLDVFDIFMYSSDVVGCSPQSSTYSISGGSADFQNLYGNEPSVVALCQDTNFARNEGLLEVATAAGSYRWVVLPSFPQYTSLIYILSSAYYDKWNDRYIASVHYTDYTYGMGGGYFTNGETHMWEYSRSMSAWVYASDLWALPGDYSDTYFKWHANVKWTSSGDQYGPYVFAISPITGKGLIIAHGTKAMHVSLTDGAIDGWPSWEVSRPTALCSARNFANTANGFSYWRGYYQATYYTGSTLGCPSYGKPTYCWLDGNIYINRSLNSSNLLGDTFWTINPDTGTWTWSGLGSFSLDGYTLHHPPVGTSYCASNSISYVYCDFNDSIYMLRWNVFYRLDMRLNAWVLCATPPFSFCISNYDVRTVDITYVPKLNRIFVIYSGVVYSYNVASDEWDNRFFLPITYASPEYGQFNSINYSVDIHRLYVTLGDVSRAFLEMELPTGTELINYNTSIESGILPEDSSYGRFQWNGPDKFIKPTSSFNGSTEYSYWFTTLSGRARPGPWSTTDDGWSTGGYVGRSWSNDSARVAYLGDVSKSTSYFGVGGLSSRVPIRGNSFTATATVRCAAMPSYAGTYYFIFGVSEGNINMGGGPGPAPNGGYYPKPQWDPSPRTSLIGRYHSRGSAGVYMASIRNTTYSHRYTLLEREGSSWVDYKTSQYVIAPASDMGFNAPLKDWTISYNAKTGALDATVSGTYIGSTTLTNRTADMFIEAGILCTAGPASSTWHIMEVGEIQTDFNDGYSTHATDTDTHRLVLNKNVAYNSGYYFDRTVPGLSSDRDFVYEACLSISQYTTVNTPYVLSIGRIRDGLKDINLCAISYAGQRRLAFWSGVDPWSSTIGYSCEQFFNWENESTYSIVKDTDIGVVDVYVNGTKLLSQAYSSFPATKKAHQRNVAFGVIDFDKDCFEEVDASLDVGGLVTHSGSCWVRSGHDYTDGGIVWGQACSPINMPRWSGSSIYGAVSAPDTSSRIEWRFTTTSGDKYLYHIPGYGTESSSATDAPITIYSLGCVAAPVPDSYATNNITSVNLYTSHSGSVDINAVTIDVNQKRTSTGYSTTDTPGGFCYLGKYTNIDRVVMTRSCSTGSYVQPGIMFLYDYDRNDRLESTSVSEWTYVKLQPGVKAFTSTVSTPGISIIDTSGGQLLDYYSTSSDPAIAGSDTTGISVI